VGSVRNATIERDCRNLRKPSKKVKQFDTNELKLLQQTMLYAAMNFERDHAGSLCVGLAAPQVGVNLRVIMVRNTNDPADQRWTFMFNPAYVESRDGFTIDHEGCLSLPDYYGKVVRPKESLFYYFTEKGKRVPQEGVILAREQYARILCHELDHLNGVLCSDNAVGEVEYDEAA